MKNQFLHGLMEKFFLKPLEPKRIKYSETKFNFFLGIFTTYLAKWKVIFHYLGISLINVLIS